MYGFVSICTMILILLLILKLKLCGAFSLPREKRAKLFSLSLSNAPNRALKVKFRNEASRLNLKLCYYKGFEKWKK